MVCKWCNKDFKGRGKYCSVKCKQSAYRNRQTVTDETVTGQNVTVCETVTDACGNKHPIDYEGRRRDYDLLESWAEGKGTMYQQRLGILSRRYSRSKELGIYLGRDKVKVTKEHGYQRGFNVISTEKATHPPRGRVAIWN